MGPPRALAVATLVSCIAALATGPASAWQIDDLLPDALSLQADHRTRYEYLDDQFRITRSGDEEVFVLRTRVRARVTLTDWLAVGAELQDSRAELSDDALLSTGIVNALELLRAYVEMSATDVFGGTLSAQGGRLTLDVGSRRFVARNRFRNTSNAFTGLDVQWRNEAGVEARTFWAFPVRRLPFLQADLRDNRIAHDEEGPEVEFWGGLLASDLPRVGRGELYVFGLHEETSLQRPTRKRQLWTPGFRLLRAPERASIDYQLEVALQAGESRASVASSRELDHFAHFEHAEIGYTFDAFGAPRVALQYDFASGDKDPNDGKNERFDTLFGARRFDFGPTGIYGPFARANLNTPGVRAQWKPHSQLGGFAAYRAYWLASDTDAWTTTGVRDPAGRSGSYIGSQIEFRIQWEVLPGNLSLETGYAHLFAGEFIRRAPNSNRQGDSNYVYIQVGVGI